MKSSFQSHPFATFGTIVLRSSEQRTSVYVTYGQEVGGSRLGGVGEDVQSAAVAADPIVGNGNQRLRRPPQRARLLPEGDLVPNTPHDHRSG